MPRTSYGSSACDASWRSLVREAEWFTCGRGRLRPFTHSDAHPRTVECGRTGDRRGRPVAGKRARFVNVVFPLALVPRGA